MVLRTLYVYLLTLVSSLFLYLHLHRDIIFSSPGPLFFFWEGGIDRKVFRFDFFPSLPSLFEPCRRDKAEICGGEKQKSGIATSAKRAPRGPEGSEKRLDKKVIFLDALCSSDCRKKKVPTLIPIFRRSVGTNCQCLYSAVISRHLLISHLFGRMVHSGSCMRNNTYIVALKGLSKNTKVES